MDENWVPIIILLVCASILGFIVKGLDIELPWDKEVAEEVLMPESSFADSTTQLKPQKVWAASEVGLSISGQNIWIYPGKIYSESSVETIKVHNGKDVPAQFGISVRKPDYTEEGYRSITDEELNQVVLSTTLMGVPSAWSETFEVSFSLPDKVEFWVSIIDRNQPGLVKAELCSRILVWKK